MHKSEQSNSVSFHKCLQPKKIPSGLSLVGPQLPEARAVLGDFTDRLALPGPELHNNRIRLDVISVFEAQLFVCTEPCLATMIIISMRVSVCLLQSDLELLAGGLQAYRPPCRCLAQSR